jgi:hypothetical protein
MDRRCFLQASFALPCWLAPGAAAAEKKAKVLYFSRSVGFEHSVIKREGGQLAHSEKIMIEMGRKNNFEVECSKDGRIFDGNLDQFDLFAFYSTGDLTAAESKDGAPPMSAAGKKRLLNAIYAGKPFVGFHSATDTFHTPGPRGENQTEVDPYIAMIGGEFVKHGPQQEASMILVSRFPGAGNIGVGEGLAFHEEWYAHKNFAKDLHVIFVQETQMMKGPEYQRPDFPATWVRLHGKGRVFYTSLGHREDVWTNPFFQTIALGGISWALGRVPFDPKPNIDQVTPKAHLLKNES